jgi:hypothetical protein
VISTVALHARTPVLRKTQPKWRVLMQSARDVIARLLDDRCRILADESFSLVARLRCDSDFASEPAVPVRHLEVERVSLFGVRVRRLVVHLKAPLRDVPTARGERVGRSWRHCVLNWGCCNSCRELILGQQPVQHLDAGGVVSRCVEWEWAFVYARESSEASERRIDNHIDASGWSPVADEAASPIAEASTRKL